MATAANDRLGGLERRELDDGCVLFTARSFAQRSRGLARLDALPSGRGLHILRCRSVHTFGMRFPLDLVFLDRSMRAVSFRRAVPPGRVAFERGAQAVLEMPVASESGPDRGP